MSKLTKLKMLRYMKLAGLSLLTAAMILIVATSLVFVIVIIKDTLTDRLLLNEVGAVATSIAIIIPLLSASFCSLICMKVTCITADVYMNKTDILKELKQKEWMRRNHQYFVDDDLPLENINKHILEEK